MNISLLLEMAAEAGPDRVGLICEGRRWRYGELLSAAQGAAQIMIEGHYSYIALLDESSEAAAIALFGAALAGIPYVPLNYRLANIDLAAQLKRIAPACIIGDVERAEKLDPDSGHCFLSRTEFVSGAQSSTPQASPEPREGEGIAAQIFTSGTTAAPKAALLRHSNLLGYILGSVEFMAADECDAQIVCVPPYHIAGISALMSSIYAMRRIVLLPAFDPDEWLHLVTKEKVTNAFLVPTMLGRIVERLDDGVAADLSSLSAIAYGGGRMPPELIARALEMFPVTDFTNAYGLTETSSTIALLGPDDHRLAQYSDDPAAKARLGSVGRPIPTVEVEVRDEDGNALPAGERGEVYVRGEQVSGEYRERSALNAEGWFPTRDAGWLDEEGYLFLAGRADDVIVRGGENISPEEIEDVLAEHPAIAEAVAIGVPSVEWGEAVGIAVVFRDPSAPLDEETLRTLIRDRLRSSRVPEQIRIVDFMPYNEMGKLLRREIRSLFQS